MKPLYKLLICGDRNWGDYSKVVRTVQWYKEFVADLSPAAELVIISGGAPGADTMARLAATELDVHCAEVNALWGTRHRAAGPQRNEIMVSFHPNQCVAFHSDLANSKGTKDMVRRCKKANINVQVVI